MTEIYHDIDAAYAADSQLAAFRNYLGAQTGQAFTSYAELHGWCCDNVEPFWRHFLDWCQLDVSGSAEPVVSGEALETAQFFPQLNLNYTQSLLRPLPDAEDSHPAVIYRAESGERSVTTRGELRDEALAIAASLQQRGIGPGDRAVAITRNSRQGIAACLGCAAVGVAWSSVAPDLGAEAVLHRFRQLQPRVLFADLAYTHHGIERSLHERVTEIAAAIPSLQYVVLFDDQGEHDGIAADVDIQSFPEWASATPLTWDNLEQFPFNQPLFILFSSGTTGAPKCIVHGSGGTLLEHLKEHRLHTNLGADDVLFFATSAGWMMWNWQLSALASGTPIMLFDGSVSYPEPGALLEVLEQERVSVFGTSPAYIQFLLESGTIPRELVKLDALRAIQSTGSVLYDNLFDWIRDNFKHVPIHSISGGTDIIGCFVLGNPLLPVYRGESQSVSLGLDVRVHTGEHVAATGTGDLVCVNRFPSRPVGIWGDSDGSRFHSSYFEEHDGIWTHGDRFTLAPSGSARILGRSDGTMKIRGVRIGPSEIYNVVLEIAPVVQAMAVQQHSPREPGGERIVLLVVLQQGEELQRPLTLRIKKEISQKASAVHVPAVVVQVSALPQTHNGKFSERAARDVVNGLEPPNRSALKNPETLVEIAQAVPAPPG